jgi:hypothetical protein
MLEYFLETIFQMSIKYHFLSFYNTQSLFQIIISSNVIIIKQIVYIFDLHCKFIVFFEWYSDRLEIFHKKRSENI